jgi:hypothetical protein
MILSRAGGSTQIKRPVRHLRPEDAYSSVPVSQIMLSHIPTSSNFHILEALH